MTINPLQAGALGNSSANERAQLQACIDYIKYWSETTTGYPATGPYTEYDSSRNAVKLVIPANRVFIVDTQAVGTSPPIGLILRGPITIEGEDRYTSRIKLIESSLSATSPGEADPGDGGSTTYADLFHAQGTDTITGITLRNFTLMGSYDAPSKDNGEVRLFSFQNVADLLFDRMVFTRNRAVLIGGDGVRGLTMRGCLLSESRRGGMIVAGASNVTVEDNDFRWVPDDPISINASGPHDQGAVDPFFYKFGGSIRIVGNRSFGCRGLNVLGAKNVLVADNISVLGKGRAIHVGVVTDQDKGDTTTLNVVIRNNIITDMLDASVDPRLDGNGGHRAIDLELLDGGPGTASPTPNVIPGLPDGTQSVVDPTRYYYTVRQGLDGAPTPHAANILVEGNIIARTRPPASPAMTGELPAPDLYHVPGFDKFDDYDLGLYGGDETGYPNSVDPDPVLVPFGYITPTEGIAVSGAARGLTIRGNQVGGCDTCISFKGANNSMAPAFALFDVVVEQNDLSDWTTAGIRFFNYAGLPQRVAIIGNRGNGDPFFRNDRGSVRKINGKWADTTTGSFIDAQGLGFAFIGSNHVRNVTRLVAGLSDTLHTMQDNVGYCDPKAVGYNVDNRGIGNLIDPRLGWRYVIGGSDPSNGTTAGKVLNTCPLAAVPSGSAATSVPAVTGTWVAGTVVRAERVGASFCSLSTTSRRAPTYQTVQGHHGSKSRDVEARLRRARPASRVSHRADARRVRAQRA